MIEEDDVLLTRLRNRVCRDREFDQIAMFLAADDGVARTSQSYVIDASPVFSIIRS